MEHSKNRIRTVAAYGKQVDFGKTASDYGRYRAGYPDELYRRLESFGVGGTLSPAQVEEFDREFAALLKHRFPTDPMCVHHRTFAMVCSAR